MKCAISCGKTRKSETLKKNMLQQADEVEPTTSKKKADYQHVPFHANVKKSLQIPIKKDTSSYYPTCRSKKMTIPDKKNKEIHEKWYFV